ncbi:MULTISPECIES: energy transducer TonB [unclassified Rhodanobacter]|uniref:energy transducer TonB family protein n=1 Tax=unclassified Rhodanobacter TaxID=2621553 RepID=UPI001BDF1012|nr:MULTISPECIES: energy transducer TonB [unclassified Rhodanobacter]MBT2144208.1 TonB family protein [Rhodanobacter sp. LX-99]MBT2150125.1 TonB family protein [Rhodanobacter sp. LX-100]
MFRLRTTTTLSLLALAVGVAGTGWLSTLTTDWPGPPPRYAAARTASAPRAALPSPRRSHAPARVVRTTRVPADLSAVDAGAAQASVPPAPELVPLAMPADTSQPWYKLRGHLDGRVLLRVDIDGAGQVRSASVSQSSGDPVLDEHALRSVHGWRFAVPPDRPDGLSGELPMRFSSQGDRIAQLP